MIRRCFISDVYVCEHPRRPTRMLVSTDADARNGRRRCPYRPTQMLVVLLRRYFLYGVYVRS
ncbi:hypothetical protein [Leyella stercorea]